MRQPLARHGQARRARAGVPRRARGRAARRADGGPRSARRLGDASAHQGQEGAAGAAPIVISSHNLQELEEICDARRHPRPRARSSRAARWPSSRRRTKRCASSSPRAPAAGRSRGQVPLAPLRDLADGRAASTSTTSGSSSSSSFERQQGRRRDGHRPGAADPPSRTRCASAASPRAAGSSSASWTSLESASARRPERASARRSADSNLAREDAPGVSLASAGTPRLPSWRKASTALHGDTSRNTARHASHRGGGASRRLRAAAADGTSTAATAARHLGRLARVDVRHDLRERRRAMRARRGPLQRLPERVRGPVRSCRGAASIRSPATWRASPAPRRSRAVPAGSTSSSRRLSARRSARRR